VSRALLRGGWIIKRRLRGGIVKRHRSSHRILLRPGWPDYVFAFHDNEEIGPRMLARIAQHTGLRPDDL
jgi:predicted RNA binding protein YcfA (HicA-like mRNA interferase family)